MNKSTKQSNARLERNLHLSTKNIFTGFIDKFKSKRELRHFFMYFWNRLLD